MVKKHTPKKLDSKKETAIREFAGQADDNKAFIDPNAPKDFFKLVLTLNEYEFNKLQTLTEVTKRTRLNAIRWAISEALEKIMKEGKE